MTTVIGFAGYSNSGKTTLIAKVAAHFEQKELRVAVIKHDAHGHYKEAAGSDSALFLGAGASASIVVSPHQTVLCKRETLQLEQVLQQLDGQYDLILIEGFKRETHPKIAIFRDEEQAGIVEAVTPPPIAWVTPDAALALDKRQVPVFHPDDLLSICQFIEGSIP
jgi:molybdopterin-guanine dinucleotide biosynthesis adapter protein